MSDKFPCCNSCLNRNDEWLCSDCHDAGGYELDESLIEIGDDGLARIRNEIVELTA